MDQAAFFLTFGAITDTGATSLKIKKVGAGGYLTVGVLTRQPNFDIIGLGCRETQVTAAEGNNPVGKLQQLQYFFGIGE